LTLEKKDSDIRFGEVLEYRRFAGILKLGLSEVHGLALKEAANTRRGSRADQCFHIQMDSVIDGEDTYL
jgi:hypothetical protein